LDLFCHGFTGGGYDFLGLWWDDLSFRLLDKVNTDRRRTENTRTVGTVKMHDDDDYDPSSMFLGVEAIAQQ
jgi:hypothetical protein